jgi:hypothetical protein
MRKNDVTGSEEKNMQDATVRYRAPRGRRTNPGFAGSIERFAVRFAELALLAGLVGAGVALLITKAG